MEYGQKFDPRTGVRKGEKIVDCAHRTSGNRIAVTKAFQAFFYTAMLALAACATVWEQRSTAHFERSEVLLAQGNYEEAFKENQKVLSEGRGAADVALFKMGFILGYSMNPKKDYPKALVFFRKVVNDYPQSPMTEQAKVWIQVLEEHQRIADERRSLTREKEVLAREKEVLSQEREKVKYMVEKSEQVDIEIEKRRRQTQTK